MIPLSRTTRIRVLVVEDEACWRRTLAKFLAKQGCEVFETSTPAEAWSVLHRERPDLVVIDHFLGETQPTGLDWLQRVRDAGWTIPAAFVTGSNEVSVFRGAKRLGSLFVPKPTNLAPICKLLDEIALSKRSALPSDEVHEIIGNSAAALALKDEIRCYAREGNRPVLIGGDTGTGKDRVARAIHRLSPRSAERLLIVDCPAIPASLIESRLFGHEQGSFTGADRKCDGFLRMVGEGTLVLDEVGELPLEVQAKLLRTIQSRRFWPVGSPRELEFCGRFVFVTNRELEQAVTAGTFRADLYYRMKMLEIRVPSVAERAEDLPDLIVDLAREIAPDRRLSTAAVRALCRRDWPGNVREIEGALVKLFAREVAPVVDLPTEADDEDRDLDREAERILARGGAPRLRLLEQRVYQLAVRLEGGSITRAATRLGASRKRVARVLASPRRASSGVWRDLSDDDDEREVG